MVSFLLSLEIKRLVEFIDLDLIFHWLDCKILQSPKAVTKGVISTQRKVPKVLGIMVAFVIFLSTKYKALTRFLSCYNTPGTVSHEC